MKSERLFLIYLNTYLHPLEKTSLTAKKDLWAWTEVNLSTNSNGLFSRTRFGKRL